MGHVPADDADLDALDALEDEMFYTEYQEPWDREHAPKRWGAWEYVAEAGELRHASGSREVIGPRGRFDPGRAWLIFATAIAMRCYSARDLLDLGRAFGSLVDTSAREVSPAAEEGAA